MFQSVASLLVCICLIVYHKVVIAKRSCLYNVEIKNFFYNLHIQCMSRSVLRCENLFVQKLSNVGVQIYVSL